MISCSLDVAGYGEGYIVQVSVSGRVSTWATGVLPFRYPRMRLDSVATLTSATPGRTLVGTAGGSLLLLRGRRLLAVDALQVSIGGVAVSPLSSLFPGGVDGSALLLAAPRGFGLVNLTLTLGGETIYSYLGYSGISLRSIVLAQGTRQSATRSYNVSGVAISSCALCFNTSINSEPCAPIAHIVNATSCALPDYLRQALIEESAQRPRSSNTTNRRVATSATATTSVSVPLTITLSGEPVTYAYISPNDTDIEIVTRGVDGTLASNLEQSNSNLTFQFSQLEKAGASIAQLSAPLLATAGGTDITLAIDNLPTTSTGSVLFKPSDFPGSVFECPTVWATATCIVSGFFSTSCPPARDYNGGQLVVPAVDPDTGTPTDAALLAAGLPLGTSLVAVSQPSATALITALGADNRTLFDVTTARWYIHRSQPCFVRIWGGTCVAAVCPLPVTQNTVVVSAPAWQGTNSLSVSLALSNTTNFVGSVSYAAPILLNTEPKIGPTSGT